MRKKLTVLTGLFFLMFLYASTAGASVIMSGDRGSFELSGTIVHNYGFDEFGIGFTNIGDPWTSHGVTYTSGDNLIIGTGTGYTTNGTPMMAYNYWSPVTGNIDAGGQYDLFGFDAGYMSSDDQGTTMTLITNLDTYVFNVDLNIASNTLFYGFSAGAGEYFTGFSIATEYSTALPGMDNVTLGNRGELDPIPEPATMVLFGIGLLGIAGVARRKK